MVEIWMEPICSRLLLMILWTRIALGFTVPLARRIIPAYFSLVDEGGAESIVKGKELAGWEIVI